MKTDQSDVCHRPPHPEGIDRSLPHSRRSQRSTEINANGLCAESQRRAMLPYRSLQQFIQRLSLRLDCAPVTPDQRFRRRVKHSDIIPGDRVRIQTWCDLQRVDMKCVPMRRVDDRLQFKENEVRPRSIYGRLTEPLKHILGEAASARTQKYEPDPVGKTAETLRTARLGNRQSP
jgi:hypothetical protein